MTIPSYAGLQTALSGLQAAQAAIDTAGQNIANANTPGYSREQVVQTERDPLSIPSLSSVTGQGSQLGLGVDITTITRVRNQFLDTSYRDQNTQTSGDSTTSTLLGQVQAALAEPSSTGLSSSLNSFWTAWSGLQNDPTSSGSGALQAVLGQGEAVAQGLNTLSGQLTSIESQVTSQYDTLTDASSGPVASDANQIAKLNVQIAQAQSSGMSPNDLLDQRDNLIDDLSQYSNVYVSQQSNGMVNVSFGNAAVSASNGTADTTPLVSGGTVNLSQNLTDTNLSGSGGTLGSLLGLYDATTGTGQVASYLTTVDGVANTLATTVNNTISTADSSGSSAPAFFTGTTAATIAVNPALSSASAPYTAAEAGAVANLSGGSADQAYNSFVTQIGGDVQTAQNAQQTSQSLLTAISQQRQSVSGVSMDEEMTNLITYQQAYQASARVMDAINSTLNTLINQVGASI